MAAFSENTSTLPVLCREARYANALWNNPSVTHLAWY